jgi:hypothetical protein
MISHGFKIPYNPLLLSLILITSIEVFFGLKFVPNFRLKICPKTFRPKWSFVKSVPGVRPAIA